MQIREALIQLNLVPGLGSVTIHRLLSVFESPTEIFRASPVVLKEVLGRYAQEGVIERILGTNHSQAMAEEMDRVQKAGVRIITLLEDDYPELLKGISDPPPILYVKGTLIKEDFASVAIVGTRRATTYGLTTACQLAQDLARCGVTVVSGLAEGIDGAAHEGALKGKGRTLAVLGHGLRYLFPEVHRKLAEKVAESGALISEFPMEVPPGKRNFPRRNRVIAGLSLGVVVVEAPLISGALITAREALEQNREVFAVPGPITSSNSRGTHRLLKDGAKLVEGPRDILEELGSGLTERLQQWKAQSPHPLLEGNPVPVGLSREETTIYEAIPIAGNAMVESLSQTTAMEPSKLLTLLTGLELKGIIRQVPGQGYSRRIF